jgi:hypothetical protein
MQISSFKINLEQDFAEAVYLSEASALLGFCPGVVKEFCRVRIWSHTEYKMVSNTTQPNNPPPPPATYVNIYEYST